MHSFCRADLDPIYYCELLDVCVTNDNGDAKITDASVNPKSGPQGIYKYSEILRNTKYM